MEGRGHAGAAQPFAKECSRQHANNKRGDQSGMKGERKGDREAYEEATLQQHSTEIPGDDDVYFSNVDFFTKHFGDHWGGQLKTKRR